MLMILSSLTTTLIRLSLISHLHMMFAPKDLGPLNLFLGIEVHKLQDGSLHLNQGKYATNLLERAKMLNAKSMSTCMITDTPLLARLSDLMEDPPLYGSIVGALHYVTITRLEILYCVKQSLSIHATSLEHSLEGSQMNIEILEGNN